MSQGSFKIFSIVYKELYICLFMATSYKTFNSGTYLFKAAIAATTL